MRDLRHGSATAGMAMTLRDLRDGIAFAALVAVIGFWCFWVLP